MPKCPNGHRNPKNQQLCSQCDALIVANGARQPSSGSPWRYAVPISLATSILLATALGFAIGHNAVPETPRTDVHTSTRHWWVVARPSFDELRNSLLDTRSALQRQDTSALGTVCRTLHDDAVVRLRAQLPAPDPQLTAELDAAIGAWTARHEVAEVLARLDAASVPAGRIYSVADIAADPHYLARGMLQTIAMGDGDALLLPGIVPKLSRTPGAQRRNAPRLGQDTDAVLAEIGLTPAQIAELKRRGVVAGSEA